MKPYEMLDNAESFLTAVSDGDSDVHASALALQGIGWALLALAAMYGSEPSENHGTD